MSMVKCNRCGAVYDIERTITTPTVGFCPICGFHYISNCQMKYSGGVHEVLSLDTWTCSECGCEAYDVAEPNYCPNCGAKVVDA